MNVKSIDVLSHRKTLLMCRYTQVLIVIIEDGKDGVEAAVRRVIVTLQ